MSDPRPVLATLTLNLHPGPEGGKREGSFSITNHAAFPIALAEFAPLLARLVSTTLESPQSLRGTTDPALTGDNVSDPG